jgi:hypothetical protein
MVVVVGKRHQYKIQSKPLTGPLAMKETQGNKEVHNK